MSGVFKLHDAQFALQLHNQINRLDVTGLTENAILPNDDWKENYKPKTLIDKTLEVIDPTPNIYTLFVQFNRRFFGNKLLSVEVKWSTRMTSCAGTCSFNTGSRYCVITLSLPLLQLRPRKDLVETLLHEMIHAFLFITNNNRDRDGHGPEFCKHMNRINIEAGTKITIYHNFHAEVKLYQQHWWKCDGPCRNKAPYFGTVRRAMNRAPGPNDNWWKDHQTTCGGTFIKIREPEKSQLKKGKKAKNDLKKPSIDKWLLVSPNNKPKSNTINSKKSGSTDKISKPGGSSLKTKGGSSVITVKKWDTNSQKSEEPGIQKLGNATNNVHGFGTGGTGSSNNKSPKSTTSSGKQFSFSGTLGGSSTGQSKLVRIFSPKVKPQSESNNKTDQVSLGPTVYCPICMKPILENKANEHIDECLIQKEKENKTPFVSSTPRITNERNELVEFSNRKNYVKCPVCDGSITTDLIMDHIDRCLTLQDEARSSAVPEEFDSQSISVKSPVSSSPSLISIEESPQNTILITDSDSETESPIRKRKSNSILDFIFKKSKIATNDDKKANCPVCNELIEIDYINGHLDNDCLTKVSFEQGKSEAGPSSNDMTREKEDENIKTNGKGIGDQDGKDEPETCLICNAVLNPSISLIQHLEDCLGNVFNDDSDNSFSYINPRANFSPDLAESGSTHSNNSGGGSSKKELSPQDESSGKRKGFIESSDRFPCPMCMTLVPRKNMSDHIAECLG